MDMGLGSEISGAGRTIFRSLFEVMGVIEMIQIFPPQGINGVRY